MNVEQLKASVTQKSGQPPQPQDNATLGQLLNATAHVDVKDYLHHCLPSETYQASQMRVLPLEAIAGEMGEGSAPGSFIRPFGFVIVATSVGGNVLCMHQSTGRVFWADHDTFSDDTIMFQNRRTGNWEYLYEYSAENVEHAMVLLSESMETFLTALLTDQLTAQLDALD